MAHLVTIVLLLATATVATGIALPLAERNERRPRDEEHDPIASELAVNR